MQVHAWEWEKMNILSGLNFRIEERILRKKVAI